MAKAKNRKPGAKKGVQKPLANPLDRAFRERLRLAAARAKFMKGTGKPDYRAISEGSGCTRQAVWGYFNVEKERGTVDLTIFLRLCDTLSVTPYWLALEEGSIDDVPVDQKPMQELRDKAPISTTEKGIVTDETHRQGKRGPQPTPSAGRAAAR